MSEVKLVVRDESADRSGTVHGSVAECFIAALSADPVSLTELDAAVDRFALESPPQGHLLTLRHIMDAEPWDAGLVVIDLAARLVVIDSSYFSSCRNGFITRHNIESVGSGTVSLSYRLADDWLFLYDAMGWKEIARMRRQERADQPVIDLREIFYGEPMLRSIINGCRQQFLHRSEIARRVRLEWIECQRRWNERHAEDPQQDPETLTMHELARTEDEAEDIEHCIFYDTIRDIHADWLMTPCAELNDQIPRAVLLRDHDRLRGDMSDREQQWCTLGQCPPGISPETHAFQFGGFNTNEIVMYYDYVREVAWACWDGFRMMPDAERAALESSACNLDNFVCDEVTRLLQVGNQWLDASWDEDPMRTPRGIINLERRRLPNGGRFHPIDPDCPCCQALAEMPGIGFWHMDGCNMDDLFAFAFHHKTIESWERDQADYRELSYQLDQEWQLAKEWGLPPKFSDPKSNFKDFWRLIVKNETGDIPLGKKLRGVAHSLVSLIVQLRIAAKQDTGHLVEQYVEPLSHFYALLQQSCEESTERQLSPIVEPNANRLLSCLNELITDLEDYLGECGEDKSDDDCEADFGLEPPHDFRWRKVLNVGLELQHTLRSFTDGTDQTSHGDWYADDIPF
jgi:hypothetical protein